MSFAEAPKQSNNLRPVEEWGTVVQLATEAGSPTKRLVPADIESLTKIDGCLMMALNGLESITKSKQDYHTLNPEEAAVMRYLLPALVQN